MRLETCVHIAERSSARIGIAGKHARGNWHSDAFGLSVRAVEFEFKEGGCRRIIRKDHEDL